jgi:hypothetical protein
MDIKTEQKDELRRFFSASNVIMTSMKINKRVDKNKKFIQNFGWGTTKEDRRGYS